MSITTAVDDCEDHASQDQHRDPEIGHQNKSDHHDSGKGQAQVSDQLLGDELKSEPQLEAVHPSKEVTVLYLISIPLDVHKGIDDWRGKVFSVESDSGHRCLDLVHGNVLDGRVWQVSVLESGSGGLWIGHRSLFSFH